MNEIENLIKKVKRNLSGNIKLPHQASSIGYDLFLLSYVFDLKDDPQVSSLVTEFIDSLSKWNLADLIERQVAYAIKIADSEGKLEYEEIHKLLSLCDEIYALNFIGLDINEDLKPKYDTSLRKRFAKESKKSKMAAEDRLEVWNKEFWWYKENVT